MAIGDKIRPELGRYDYGQFLQGSAAGSQALGQGLQTLGAGAGKFLEDRGEARKRLNEGKTLGEAVKKLYAENPEVVNFVDEQLIRMEDAPLAKGAAMADSMKRFVGMAADKTAMDMRKDMFSQELQLGRDRLAANLGTNRAQLFLQAQGEQRLGRESEARINTQAVRAPLELDLLKGQIEAGEFANDLQLAQAAANQIFGRSLDVIDSPEELGDALKWGTKRVAKELKLTPRQKMLADGAVYGQLTSMQLAQLKSSGNLPPALAAAEKQFGADAAEWRKNRPKAQASLAKLEEAIERHKKLGSGPNIGPASQSGVLRSLEGLANYWTGGLVDRDMTERFSVQEDIFSIAQDAMRQTLGSQFTEREGVNMLKRTYNAADATENNTVRLETLLQELRMRMEANDRMIIDLYGGDGAPAKGFVSPETARGLQWTYDIHAGREGKADATPEANAMDALKQNYDLQGNPMVLPPKP